MSRSHRLVLVSSWGGHKLLLVSISLVKLAKLPGVRVRLFGLGLGEFGFEQRLILGEFGVVGLKFWSNSA